MATKHLNNFLKNNMTNKLHLNVTNLKLSMQLSALDLNLSSPVAWVQGKISRETFLIDVHNYDFSSGIYINLGFAYDLDTLIQRLPKRINTSANTLPLALRFWYEEDVLYIGYQTQDGFNTNLLVQQEANEKIVNCVGRLLLLLKTNNLL